MRFELTTPSCLVSFPKFLLGIQELFFTKKRACYQGPKQHLAVFAKALF